jgi:hypothetical protein
MKSRKYRWVDEMATRNRANRKIDWQVAGVWAAGLLFCIVAWAILISALREAFESLPTMPWA